MKNKFLLSALVLSAIVLYAWLFEPNYIQVRQISIPDPVLARQWGGLKIVQISDLHITRIGYREREVLRKLATIGPDLIVITGDCAQWGCRPDEAVKFLKLLKAPFGVYGVIGDADYSSRRYHCLICHPRDNYHGRRTSPLILRNEIINIALPGQNKTLALAGVFPAREQGLEHSFLKLIDDFEPRSKACLVLGHFSSDWTRLCARTNRPLLWLAGDTHGGQIRLPGFIWRLLKIKPDTKHMAGLFRNHDRHQWLYVNRGLGTTKGFPFRLGVRPEITVFTFKHPASN